MDVLYEDNHIIIVNKRCGEIVQGDKTGDIPLSEMVKEYIKEKYNKPGKVFLGVVHRLDRPVGGVVVFAKTSKALTRLNEMFRQGDVKKTYWAIVERRKERKERNVVAEDANGASSVLLHHWLTRDTKRNMSFAHDREVVGSKEAKLRYELLRYGTKYMLLEIHLLTGRHHQIRCQLSKVGLHIKGDLKYGAARSNPDGGISLLAHEISFIHPVSKEKISIKAPLPKDSLWEKLINSKV